MREDRNFTLLNNGSFRFKDCGRGELGKLLLLLILLLLLLLLLLAARCSLLLFLLLLQFRG